MTTRPHRTSWWLFVSFMAALVAVIVLDVKTADAQDGCETWVIDEPGFLAFADFAYVELGFSDGTTAGYFAVTRGTWLPAPDGESVVSLTKCDLPPAVATATPPPPPPVEATPTPTEEPSSTPTSSPQPTPTSVPTASPTPAPQASPSPSPLPEPSPTPTESTPTPTPSPRPTPTPDQPEATPTPTPDGTPPPTPTPTEPPSTTTPSPPSPPTISAPPRLPDTGADPGLLLIGGLTLLIAGGMLVAGHRSGFFAEWWRRIGGGR